MSGPRPGALSAVPRFARDDIEARLCAWWTASFDSLRMPSTAPGCLRQVHDAFDSTGLTPPRRSASRPPEWAECHPVTGHYLVPVERDQGGVLLEVHSHDARGRR